ncbi:MAG: cyanophycinase [Synechocystis sp.]|nr:cyanophycinase [Synechocystis sp.]
MPLSSQPAILIIGGAEDKVHGREILQTFWLRSGGTDAVIGIIPSASREPLLIGDRYQSIFQSMGVQELKVLDVRDRSQGDDPGYREFVDSCTGIFMTGGDQLRLCGLLADTPLMNRIRQRVHQGEISLAGTSAGAAVMGHHMIAGGSSGEWPNRALVDMAVGLGIIPEIIVDQHFHNRNRMARLLSAISTHPDRLGLGIDEDTCAMFEPDGSIRIIGQGTVSFVDAQEMTYTNASQISANSPLSLHGLRLNVLVHGETYFRGKKLAFPRVE